MNKVITRLEMEGKVYVYTNNVEDVRFLKIYNTSQSPVSNIVIRVIRVDRDGAGILVSHRPNGLHSFLLITLFGGILLALAWRHVWRRIS